MIKNTVKIYSQAEFLNIFLYLIYAQNKVIILKQMVQNSLEYFSYLSLH